MVASPPMTHEYRAQVDGSDVHVVASFWRRPGMLDVWRIEAFSVLGDEVGPYYEPLPGLTMDVPAEAIGEAEADRRTVANAQRDLAAPHLRYASECDAQAGLLAALTDRLAEEGAPPPAEPLRAVEPTEPAPEPPAERLRQPAPTGPVG